MDHWALLMMKHPELQILEETPLPSISWRRHHARSPETSMPAGYHAVYLSAFRYLLLAFHRYEEPTSARRSSRETSPSASSEQVVSDELQ